MTTEAISSPPGVAVPSLRAGVKMGLTRVSRRTTVFVALATFLATVVIAFVERRESAHGAADRTLAALFRIILPLAAFSLSQLAIGAKNLRDTVWPAARFGMHRGLVAVGHIVAGGLVSGVVALVCAVTGVAIARVGRAPTAHEMSIASDLLASAWIAPLVAFAYASWSGLGSTFGKLGGGRGVVLAMDFILGSAGFLGVIFPRGSAYNLIGLEAPLDLPQRAASGILLLVIVVTSALTALRCRS